MTTTRDQPSPSEVERADAGWDGREAVPVPVAAPASGGTMPGGLMGYAATSSGLRELRSVEEVRSAYAEPGTNVWVDLESPPAEVLTDLAVCFGLHPLIVEDIAERNQRAKFEVTGETVHLVMFALLYAGELVDAEIDIVLGQRFLLTSHPTEWQPRQVPHFRRGGVEPFLRDGPDYVLWAVVDALVDGYFPVFDRVGDEIDQLQDDVLDRPSRWLVERLFQVRRDLLTIRHVVGPQREIFNQLTNRDMKLVKPERVVYFRDVYDHLIRLTDELDTYRELTAGTLDAYLTTVNNNLSEVMKRLTAATVIFAAMGAAAGIFGMSEAGPSLAFAEQLGFWLVTGVVLLLGVGAFLWFRRIGWL